MLWATSDHHFGHANILKYCAETRQVESLDEMNAQLISRWNEKIAPDDDVFLVGDAFCSRRMPREMKVGILQMLNGRKTLIRGNHDDKIDIFHEAGFVQVVNHLVINEKILVIHKSPDPGFAREEWNIAASIKPGLIVHGHTHALGQNNPKCMNVCVDWHNLYPVPWSSVEERLLAATDEIPDWASG